MNSPILAAFEAKLGEAHTLVESRPPIRAQVDTALKLCDELACDLSFEIYTEVHSKAVSFFGVIVRDFQEDTKKYSKEVITCEFYHALQYPLLVPRLYVAFILACCDPSEELMNIIVEMLSCVCHPMRGFMLRFTAISFYPSTFASLGKFVLGNLKGMLELAPMFVAAHPVAEDAVCGWLAANISIGVFCAKEREETIRQFLELATQNRNEPSLALNIVSAVVQTVSSHDVLQMLPVISRFFDGMEPTAKVLRAVGFCFQRTKSPVESYKFIVDTPFEEPLASKVLQMCIDSKDMETLRLCLGRWPTEDHFLQALNAVGNTTFAEICPPLNRAHETVLIAYIENTDESSAELVVDMISEVRLDHSENFENSLNDMIIRMDIHGAPLQHLFEDPFRFLTAPLFSSVMERLKSSETPLSALIPMLRMAESVDASVRTNALCLIWDETGNCEDLFSLLEDNMMTDSNLSKIISILPMVSPSDSQIQFIFEKCSGKESLLAFLDFITSQGKVPLLNKTIELLLQIDETIPEISGRIDLYMKTLDFLPRVPDAFDPTLIDKTIGIIENTLTQTSRFPHFPLAPAEKITTWRTTIDQLLQFQQFAEPLARISSLLCL